MRPAGPPPAARGERRIRLAKRIAALLAAALCCVGLLCGCGKDTVNFIYYISDEIRTLDPQLASTASELTAVKNLFAGLYRLDEEGQPQLDRATAVSVSADGLVYTFTLDPDDRFSDGGETSIPVTADDYVFALQRVVDPATGSAAANGFLSILNAEEILAGEKDPSALGVRAVSDTELQITLKTPDDGLPKKLAGAAAMPCNEAFFDSTAGAYGLSLDNILGNGAFQATSWSADNGLTLRRLVGDEGKLINRIRLVPDDGEKTAAQRLEEGGQDGALIDGEEESLAAYPSLSFEATVWALVFNCGDESLSNLSIRQALAAMARLSDEELAPVAGVRAAGGLVPGASVLIDGSGYRGQAGDLVPVRAESQSYALYRQGLGQLGVERLSGLKVLIPDEAGWAQVYTAINQRWQRSLAAFFSVEALPRAELSARLESGDYDIALVPLTLTEEGPQGLLGRFASDQSANPANYQSAAFDALARAGLTATDASAQLAQWAAAEKLLLEDAAVAPLAFQTNHFYLSADLAGVVVDPFGPVIDLSYATRG